MKRPRISVAFLCVLIALAAVDCAWYRSSFEELRSAFGFGDAPAFDTGVVPMANILAIALYSAARRRFRVGPFLVGFLVAGLLAIVTFVALGWSWPDGVRIWLRPIYTVWAYCSSRSCPQSYLFVADTVCFLPLQLLVASAGGLLSWLFFGRSRRTASTETE